ncbi:hypothetical protein SDC9_134242 [bioreactor metagenome]|uniref:Coenzyme PQQ synthesis protein D n=1 Tax=bioreactor metagenome TaxID=1076179 RepID=A0A645DDN8_9ZZZZ
MKELSTNQKNINKKTLKKQVNILELTPVQLLNYEYRQDGQIDVLVPRFKYAFFQKMIPKTRSPYIRANLDEIGTVTWELIDGKRKVYEIADILKERFQDKINPAYERLSLFIQKMNTNKFITFIEFMEK